MAQKQNRLSLKYLRPFLTRELIPRIFRRGPLLFSDFFSSFLWLFLFISLVISLVSALLFLFLLLVPTPPCSYSSLPIPFHLLSFFVLFKALWPGSSPRLFSWSFLFKSPPFLILHPLLSSSPSTLSLYFLPLPPSCFLLPPSHSPFPSTGCAGGRPRWSCQEMGDGDQETVTHRPKPVVRRG